MQRLKTTEMKGVADIIAKTMDMMERRADFRDILLLG